MVIRCGFNDVVLKRILMRRVFAERIVRDYVK